MLREAFPERTPRRVEPLIGGLRNTSLLVSIDGLAERFVLRVYEHERSLCQKEMELHARVRGDVPVAEIIYASPDSTPPFVVVRHVEGVTFRELVATRDAAAISEAAGAIGEVLATIGRHAYASPPLLEGPDPCPRFVDGCLATPHATRRLDRALRDEVHGYIWRWAARLAELDEERRLVHCDFGSRNLLVRPGTRGWEVAAVLDWEFAVAASPLVDVGHFLRYERDRSPSRVEPWFSRGFLRAGGALPTDWLEASRALDLTALVESLSRPTLPDEVVSEILDLVRATVEQEQSRRAAGRTRA
jgi:aminoglycoside phosphotransferase (APT) family kinase protein